jgi:hypothetical protein
MVAAAFAVPPTPSPDKLFEAAPPQKTADSSARVQSERGSRTTLLIAGGAVLAFAGGLGIGGITRRSARRRAKSADAAPLSHEPEATPSAMPAAEPPAMPAPDTVAVPPAETPAIRPAEPPATSAPATAAADTAAMPAPAPRPAEPSPADSVRAPAPEPDRPRPAPRPQASSPRPRAPAPRPVPEGPVFTARVPWPPGTEGTWRCEIGWQSGYRRSEFRALVTAPGARKARVLATSPQFRNLIKDPADTPRPELANAVRDLMSALVEQGWTPVPPGGRWYSRRFVWPGDGPPPGVD